MAVANGLALLPDGDGAAEGESIKRDAARQERAGTGTKCGGRSDPEWTRECPGREPRALASLAQPVCCSVVRSLPMARAHQCGRSGGAQQQKHSGHREDGLGSSGIGQRGCGRPRRSHAAQHSRSLSGGPRPNHPANRGRDQCRTLPAVAPLSIATTALVDAPAEAGARSVPESPGRAPRRAAVPARSASVPVRYRRADREDCRMRHLGAKSEKQAPVVAGAGFALAPRRLMRPVIACGSTPPRGVTCLCCQVRCLPPSGAARRAVNHSARVVGIGHTAQKVPLVTCRAPKITQREQRAVRRTLGACPTPRFR